ncbi:MAG: esterase-like activity of phytase family protein [Alphaproteobacteria bacterium]
MLPAPASGVGAGKVSLDAESLQFTRDGGFYVGDEICGPMCITSTGAAVLLGVIDPADRDRAHTATDSFSSVRCKRRIPVGVTIKGLEGMSLSPDGRTLFVALQSALVQDSATGERRRPHRHPRSGLRREPPPTPARPVAHYVVQLPAYNDNGDGGAPNRNRRAKRNPRARRP